MRLMRLMQRVERKLGTNKYARYFKPDENLFRKVLRFFRLLAATRQFEWEGNALTFTLIFLLR